MSTSTQTNKTMVPVLYCDIDGTIRWGKDELGRFVNTADDVRVFDGVADLLWSYKKLGWRIIGVSNQGGIALGHMTMLDCVRAMAETHRQTMRAFDKLVWCSHHPDAKDPEMAICWCRKPKAGLVIEGALVVAEKYPGEVYPPHLGLFVGDRFEDAECARNAGLQFMNAAEWREGKHLALLGYRKDIADYGPGRDVIADEVSNERLSDEELARALLATGAKTKVVRVQDLSLADEFVYEGILYTVVEKGDYILKAKNYEDLSLLTFYDLEVLRRNEMPPESLVWSIQVVTDDK